MGLPRLPEAFHRVYSPPEAPKAKRHRAVGAATAVVAFAVLALAAGAVLAYGRVVSPSKTASMPPHQTPAVSHTPAPHVTQPPTFAAIPAACDILPAGTVRRFVPTTRPKIERIGVDTAGVCTYSMQQGSRYRAIQVDARAFLPRYIHDQATSMTVWSYEAQWRQAQKDLTADTSSLRRIGGLGDAAFERYWIDRDVHVAVGETTVRYRNVVLRVEYTEEQPSAQGRTASEQRCLEAAISAARDGLAALR